MMIADQVGDVSQQARTRRELGQVELDSGRLDAAQTAFSAALEHAREGGDDRRLGTVLGDIARVQFAAGRPTEGRATLDASAALLERIGDRVGLAMTFGIRAVREARVDPEAARDYLARAVSLAEELGTDPQNNLGRLLAEARDVVPP
jgi:tetratricopeptide (TPR) repeat protein